ncbi:hypothetical protein V1281_000273 [Nitrobacteraceae bacterium AZCC 2161]
MVTDRVLKHFHIEGRRTESKPGQAVGGPRVIVRKNRIAAEIAIARSGTRMTLIGSHTLSGGIMFPGKAPIEIEQIVQTMAARIFAINSDRGCSKGKLRMDRAQTSKNRHSKAQGSCKKRIGVDKLADLLNCQHGQSSEESLKIARNAPQISAKPFRSPSKLKTVSRCAGIANRRSCSITSPNHSAVGPPAR